MVINSRIIIHLVNIKNYPTIKEHLDQYYDKLDKRRDKGYNSL